MSEYEKGKAWIAEHLDLSQMAGDVSGKLFYLSFFNVYESIFELPFQCLRRIFDTSEVCCLSTRSLGSKYLSPR